MKKTSETLARARHCYRQGAFHAAAEQCRRILREQPGRLQALYLLGAACHEEGKLDNALAQFEEILRLCPSSARAHHARASVLQERGDLDEAVRSLRESVRLRPGLVLAQISLGLALQTQGKAEEAEGCFREVLRWRPNLPEAHMALGAALQAQGKHEEAAACYREAIRVDPDAVAAHNNLAALQIKRGELREAAASVAAVLRQEPDCAEALYNLGTILHRRKEFADAIQSYRQALRRQPDFVAALSALADALIEDGQHETARETIQQVLRLDPHQAEAHASMGKLLLQDGRREEAAHSFREALRCNPNCAGALAPVAIFDVFPLDDAELGRIRDLLARPDLPVYDASRLHFGLGAVQDRAGAYDLAFEHFRQANVLRRRFFHEGGKVFDREAHTAWIDHLIATCDAGYFQRLEGMGRTTERPVFIVGMPRSGTSLVEQILASHPEVFGAGELMDIEQCARELPARLAARSDVARSGDRATTQRSGDRATTPVVPRSPDRATSHTPVVARSPDRATSQYPSCLARLDENTAKLLADQYLARLARASGPAARVTDKMPLNVLHLGLIAALFPRARVIHCVRDPLDVCLSCYFQDFGQVAFSCDLEDLGHFYREYERLMAHWRRVLPLPLMEVVYEELVADQEAVTRRLVAFCGLAWDERCLRQHKNPRAVHTASQVQVRKPVYSSSVGRWRNYAKHLQPLFQAISCQLPER